MFQRGGLEGTRGYSAPLTYLDVHPAGVVGLLVVDEVVQVQRKPVHERRAAPQRIAAQLDATEKAVGLCARVWVGLFVCFAVLSRRVVGAHRFACLLAGFHGCLLACLFLRLLTCLFYSIARLLFAPFSFSRVCLYTYGPTRCARS